MAFIEARFTIGANTGNCITKLAMQKPFKYTIICNKTNEITETNIEPLVHHLETWEPIDENTKIKVQTKTCYLDTRYEAKLRLYNYLEFTKHGKEIPKYKPFQNTQIGKTIPILNF